MKSPLVIFLVALPLALGNASHAAAQATPAAKPNILVILADDLGYGDVRCYNDQSKVARPQLDRLAREGMRFTDAHSRHTLTVWMVDPGVVLDKIVLYTRPPKDSYLGPPESLRR